MKSLYGFDIQLGKSLLNYMTVKVDREAAKKNIDRVLLKCEKVTEEAYSGDELLARQYFEVSHSPIINPDKEVAGVIVMARDITQRKQLVEAVVRSEERYRTILEQMQDSYYEVDLAGNFTFVSESAGHSIGYAREEMIGQNYRLMVPEKDIKSIFAVYNEVYRTGTPNKGFSHRIHHKDGRIIFSEVSIDLNRNKQGEVIGFKCVSRDITERRESEERFTASFNINPDPVAISEADTAKRILVNPAFEKWSGYSKEELIGATLEQLLAHPEDRDRILTEFKRNNELSDLEIQLRRKNGEIRDTLFSVSFIEIGGERYLFSRIHDISERSAIEKALRESEAQYRLLSEHTTDTIFLLDMNLKMTYHSPSGEKLRGFTTREIMEMPLDKTLTPESLKLVSELFFEEIPRVVADKDYNPIRTLDLEYSCKDGATVWAESKFSIIRDGSGKAVSILGEGRDITDRKKAEEALRESEERFRNMANLLPQTVFETDEKGNFTFVNRQGFETFGYSEADVATGTNVLQTIIPQDQDRAVENISHRIKGEELPSQEYTAIRKDGIKFPVAIYASPIIINSRYAGMRGMLIDMTERNRIESVLKESEEKYRLVVENALEAIFIAVAGMFIFVNRRATEISGYSQEELTSRPFIEFVHPDDRQGVAEHYLQRLSGRDAPNPNAFRGVCKSGDIKWVELTAVPITWEGRPATLNFMTDITERKRLEEEQQRVEKLESVGLLAGGIAHDFNNILTAILGNISLAKTDAAHGSELQNSLEQAEKASMRAKDLTLQLLTFSRGGAPVKKLASLTDLLQDTVGFALRGSNVKCRLSIPADLWHAEIDTGQVSQVIQNLVINAQQAMPTGGTVELIAENMVLSETQSLGKGLPLRTGNYVRIAVTDHGSGIPAEHMDKIFDPFFTTKQKGSGLGLATSFSIARNHGGHLSVESEPGAGSTFYLYLPASMETATPKQVKKEASKPAGKARILVMDDEQGVREIAGRMLNHIGYKDVEFAADGAEAIKLYKAARETGNPFRAVILDLTIAGGMGGKETVRKLLKIDPGVKAIVSSGYVDEAVMAMYREYGFSGMVAKPYTLEELRRALEDVM